MELTIREATGSDAEAVARLLADMGHRTSAGTAAAHIAHFAGDPASRLGSAEDKRRGQSG